MRTVCRTVDDFLENLRIEIVAAHERTFYENSVTCPIHRKSIFLTQYSDPIGEDKRNAVRFNVMVQVSAVISTEEGEYLLECTENMGIDYHDSSEERNGTEKAALVVAKIKEFCETNGLIVRPGSVTY